jgi:hypothetical protein
MKLPTLNYDVVTDLGVEVIIQVERAAQVTHGEFTINNKPPEEIP